MGFEPGSEEWGRSIFQVDESQGWGKRLRREGQETLASIGGGVGVVQTASKNRCGTQTAAGPDGCGGLKKLKIIV